MAEIEGISEALKFLEEYPFSAEKIIKKSAQKAAAAGVKLIKSRLPHASYKRVTRYKVYGQDWTVALIGLFGSKWNSDTQFRFMKAYWNNYGTLRNRDTSHKFANSIKPISADRNGGIRPQHFFEKSLSGVDNVVFNTFKEQLNKNTIDSGK